MSDFGRGAIFYDYLKVPGGAERVTLELAHYFAADLYVGYEQRGVMDSLGFGAKPNTLSLAARSNFLPLEAYSLLRGFQRAAENAKAYDWAVYSGMFSPLAVSDFSSRKNILYCHSLPRFIYDLYGYCQQQDPWLQRISKQIFGQILRPKYEIAVGAMDVLVANSRNVQSRIKRFLHRDAVVVHPPCDIEQNNWSDQEGYYLSLARLEPYKRVDRLVEAFLSMPDKKLIVTSGGSDYSRLKRIANNANNIVFTGWMNAHRLRELISKSIATLYIPINEDFGMSPVESMAAGKPVIGVQEGGLLETVLHGQTGILLQADPSVEMIVRAVETLTPDRAINMREACEQQSTRFGRQAFFKNIEQIIMRPLHRVTSEGQTRQKTSKKRSVLRRT